MSSPSPPRTSGDQRTPAKPLLPDRGDVFVERVVVVVDDERERGGAAVGAPHLSQRAPVLPPVQVEDQLLDEQAVGLPELLGVQAGGKRGDLGPQVVVVAVHLVDLEPAQGLGVQAHDPVPQVVGEDPACLGDRVVGHDAVPHQVRARVRQQPRVEGRSGGDVRVEPEVRPHVAARQLREEAGGIREAPLVPFERAGVGLVLPPRLQADHVEGDPALPELRDLVQRLLRAVRRGRAGHEAQPPLRRQRPAAAVEVVAADGVQGRRAPRTRRRPARRPAPGPPRIRAGQRGPPLAARGAVDDRRLLRGRQAHPDTDADVDVAGGVDEHAVSAVDT